MSYDRDNEDWEDRNPGYDSWLKSNWDSSREEVRELQQRLIDRTEQSLATACRDSRRIAQLENEVRELEELVSHLRQIMQKTADTMEMLLRKDTAK